MIWMNWSPKFLFSILPNIKISIIFVGSFNNLNWMFGIWKYKLAADAGKFWERKVFCHFAQWTRRGKYNTDRRYTSSADIFCNNNNNHHNHRSREHCGPRPRAPGGGGPQLPALVLGDAGGGAGGARLLRPRPRPRLHAEAGQQQGQQQGHQQGQQQGEQGHQGHGRVTPEGDCGDGWGRVAGEQRVFTSHLKFNFQHSRLRQDILQYVNLHPRPPQWPEVPVRAQPCRPRCCVNG